MKNRVLRYRSVIIIIGILIAAVSSYTWLARAVFTSALEAYAVWPTRTILDPMNQPITIRGKAEQQVFRTGGPLGNGTFASLDPKNGLCPSGSLGFLKGGPGTIGANDFVYAIKLTNTAVPPVVQASDNPVNITQISTSFCLAGAGLQPTTSIGYCALPAQFQGVPTNFNEGPGGLDFFWGNVPPPGNPANAHTTAGDHSIPPGQTSVIIFYTSPIPPARASATISGFGITQQAVQGSGPPPSDDPVPPGNMNNFPIYGPCRTEIKIDKQVACAANGFTVPSFGPGPGKSATALNGADVFYQLIVYNSGGVRLDNVMISDPKLKAGGDLTSDFLGVKIFSGNPSAGGLVDTGKTFSGILLPNESITKVFGPFDATTGAPVAGTTVNGVNTASAKGDYLMPNPDGSASGQSVVVGPVTDSATLSVVAPAITCAKTVNGLTNLTIPENAVYPFLLTYVLKGTNTGTTNLDITIDDPKLKELITFPPPGITPGGDALSKVCPGVAPGGMCQATVTLSLASAAAFQAVNVNGKSLADTGSPFTATNTMKATGVVAGFTGCTTGAPNMAMVECTAIVNQTPPCSIMLTKDVACDVSPAPLVFADSVKALKNAKIVFRLTVKNTGPSTLTNVVVTDPDLPGSPFNVGTLQPSGQPGDTSIINVPAFAPNVAGPKINTATATGTCQPGNRQVNSQDTATVNVFDASVLCDKTVNGGKEVANYVFGSLLTYKLTATNSSPVATGTNLNLMLSDPVLSGLPGVTCRRDDTNAIVALPFTFTNVPPGQSRSITCTVSFASEAAFNAASGGGSTLVNTLTVTGTVTDTTICASGVPPAQLTCNSQARVSIERADFCIVTRCVGDACRGNDPGLPTPDTSPVSDQRPGSVLIYNLYTSSSANPAIENTRLNITNTAQGTVFVHLFFVDGETCSVADSFICLSQNQTLALLASDIDPGIRGYMVAVAVDERGCPIRWNYLIGDEYVKLQTGHAANLAAEGFAALRDDPTGCNANSSIVPIRLDGISYSSAPRVLAVDNILSNRDNNQTMLVINRLGGELIGNASSIGSLFGLLFDELETPFSFSFSSSRCQLVSILSTSFPRTTPRIDNIIPAGQSGWMKFWSVNGNGLLGSVLLFNPNAATNSSAYTQGHNLHKLTLGGTAEYTFPVFPPNVP